MSASLLGDPASVAALAATMRRRSAELAARADRVVETHADAAAGWVGPVSVGHRRRLDGCVQSTTETVAEMVALADALEAFGHALAEARHEVARASDEARSVGLTIEDGSVTQEWGITGEADADAGARRSEVAEVLTRRLARATTLLERRRLTLAQRADEVVQSLP